MNPPRGLHWSVSMKVDPLLQAGVSAGRILSHLKIEGQVASHLLPTSSQIDARRKTVIKTFYNC